MFCDSCGKEILKDDRFCPYCGAKVSEGNVGAEISTHKEPPVPPMPSYVNAQREVFTGAATIQQALEIAAERANSWHAYLEEEEDFEPEDLQGTTDIDGLYKLFGLKRGKSYPITDTDQWPQYIVSREGAIGSILYDARDSEPDIFWDATTLERVAKHLPKYRKEIIIQ